MVCTHALAWLGVPRGKKERKKEKNNKVNTQTNVQFNVTTIIYQLYYLLLSMVSISSYGHGTTYIHGRSCIIIILYICIIAFEYNVNVSPSCVIYVIFCYANNAVHHL